MNDWLRWPPTWGTLLLLPAIFVGFTVHELAHALVAYLLGDTSQVERKRLSFNPLRHVSWFGMVMFLLVGFGWAKPVWVDYTRFRIKNRAWGLFLVSIAGAAANFLAALVVLVAVSMTALLAGALTDAGLVDVILYMSTSGPELDAQAVVVALTYDMFIVNLLLAIFNLLPLPPLDGFQALYSLYRVAADALRRRRGLEPAAPVSRGVMPGRQLVGRRGLEPRGPGGSTPAPGHADLSPAQIHFQIGLDYQREGQLDEAIARYRQAIAHDEAFALAYYNSGLAFWAKGRLNLAESSFRAALRSARDVGLQIQADLRLREIARVQESPGEGEQPDVAPGPAAQPLELGVAVEAPDQAARELDPVVARQVWVRLGIGGALALGLSIAGWVVATVLVLLSVA
jgi:Zn-dependent protease